MIEINEDRLVNFLIGFATGTIFIMLIALASNCSVQDYDYKYMDIGKLTCLEINSEIVSCDWSEFSNG